MTKSTPGMLADDTLTRQLIWRSTDCLEKESGLRACAVSGEAAA